MVGTEQGTSESRLEMLLQEGLLFLFIDLNVYVCVTIPRNMPVAIKHTEAGMRLAPTGGFMSQCTHRIKLCVG